MKTYQIIFQGKFRSNISREQAQQNLAELFNTELAQILPLFDGDVHVLKEKLNIDQAPYYQTALLDIGIISEIIESPEEDEQITVDQQQSAYFSDFSQAQSSDLIPVTSDAIDQIQPDLQEELNIQGLSLTNDDVQHTSDTYYDLSFSGSLLAGFTVVQAAELFAELSGQSITDIQDLFDGKTYVLKQKVDETTANQYVEKLAQCGMLIDVTYHIDDEAQSIANHLTAQPLTSSTDMVDENTADENIEHIQSIEINEALHNAKVTTQSTLSHIKKPKNTDIPQLVDFEGRLGSAYFLALHLPLLIILYFIVLLNQHFVAHHIQFNEGYFTGTNLIMLASILCIKLTLLFFQSSLYVRRFHDLNLSGYYFIPIFIINLILMAEPLTLAFTGLCLLVIGLMPSKAQTNQFGLMTPPTSIGIKLLSAVTIILAIISLASAPVLLSLIHDTDSAIPQESRNNLLLDFKQ